LFFISFEKERERAFSFFFDRVFSYCARIVRPYEFKEPFRLDEYSKTLKLDDELWSLNVYSDVFPSEECYKAHAGPSQRARSTSDVWGAPRIHGELLKLGFDVSERSVSRYLHRLSPSDQARKLWATFLRNHREVIAAMDFFTVPTLTFRVLYCFFVIEHGRRKILHFNVTDHPSSSWIVQQLREAFPEPCPYRYAILDRDAKFGKDVTDLLVSSGIKPKRTSFRSPWQDGIAERWIGSCRRDPWSAKIRNS
jgi:transposase InsO family protein